jgi:hypothetical protein
MKRSLLFSDPKTLLDPTSSASDAHGAAAATTVGGSSSSSGEENGLGLGVGGAEEVDLSKLVGGTRRGVPVDIGGGIGGNGVLVRKDEMDVDVDDDLDLEF